MKSIKFDELNKDELLTQTEPISIEHNGKLVGYYYPAIDHEKDKYLAVSQSDEVKKQVNLGREFMNEYHETFQELAK